MSGGCAVLKVVYEHPLDAVDEFVMVPGERWLVSVVSGKLVAQPVPDDVVVISRRDLPPGWG